MDERAYLALEFNKILDILASFCQSEAGKKEALALRPLPDLEAALTAQELFDQCQTWLGETSFKLQSFPDLSGVLGYLRAASPQLDQDAFWAMKEVLRLAEQSITSICSNTSNRPALALKAQASPFPAKTFSALRRCIADDASLKDESSPGLLLARNELRSLQQSCLRRVKDFAEQYNIGHYLQGEYMSLSSDRFVLPLKANFKGRLQGVVHDYSHSGETIYFEPLFLVEQNNRLQELKQQEREEERKVLRFLTELVLAELPELCASWDFLLFIDLSLAKCALSEAFYGRLTRINASAPNLLQARHPLLALEKANPKQRSSVQAIDILFRPEDRALVISGGNAGGKTVALKTLGLIALMTLSGLPTPTAAGSSLPPWQKIYAFIGDEQSLDDHVSTFTGQITHLAQIWDSLDENALILLDEFGAGTDPAQGAALAQATLDALLDKGAYVVTATHFPALKSYALTKDKVRAASVVFDPVSKKPLFHLAYDQVGASQALDVAREHGLPEEVLRRAQQYLLLDGEDSANLLDRLNALAAEREKELTRLQQEQHKTKEKRKHLQESLEQERARLRDELQSKARELMQAWKSDKISAKQAHKELSSLKASLGQPLPNTQEEAPASLKIEDLKPGDKIWHKPWAKNAQIQELDSKAAKARIDLNGVSLWANLDDLALAASSASTPNQKNSGVIVNRSSEPVSYLRLDLRGNSSELAIAELERFLDQSLLANKDGLEIIHGRGTGALRKAVHAYLKKHQAVAEFACAPEDQGGDGVTLARLK